MSETSQSNEQIIIASEVSRSLLEALPSTYGPPFQYLGKKNGIWTLVATYLGENPAYLSLPVQIKICDTWQCGSEEQASFFITSDWLMKLQNPHIIAGIEQGHILLQGKSFPFYTTEYCEGDTLRQFLDKAKKCRYDLDPMKALWLLEQMADAVLYLYKTTKEYHGSLCPQFFAFDNVGQLKLTDLGWIAPGNWELEYVNENKHPLTQYMPTLDYSLVDSAQDMLYRNMDVVALGMIYYEMLTRNILFEEKNISKMVQAIGVIQDEASDSILRHTLFCLTNQWDIGQLHREIKIRMADAGVPISLVKRIMHWTSYPSFLYSIGKRTMHHIYTTSISYQDWPIIVWKKLTLSPTITPEILAGILETYWQKLDSLQWEKLLQKIIVESSYQILEKFGGFMLALKKQDWVTNFFLELPYSTKYHTFFALLWEKYPSHPILIKILAERLAYSRNENHLLHYLGVRGHLTSSIKPLENMTSGWEELPSLIKGMQSTNIELCQVSVNLLLQIYKKFQSQEPTFVPARETLSTHLSSAPQSSPSYSSTPLLQDTIIWILAFGAESEESPIAIICMQAISQLGKLANKAANRLLNVLRGVNTPEITVACIQTLEQIECPYQQLADIISFRLKEEEDIAMVTNYIQTLARIAPAKILIPSILFCIQNKHWNMAENMPEENHALIELCTNLLYDTMEKNEEVLPAVLNILDDYFANFKTTYKKFRRLLESPPKLELEKQDKLILESMILCCKAISHIKSKAESAISFLTTRWSKIPGELREQCLELLLQLDVDGTKIMPTLLESLHDPSWNVRKKSAEGLFSYHWQPHDLQQNIELALAREDIGEFISLGESALPHLLQVIGNTEYSHSFQKSCIDIVMQSGMQSEEMITAFCKCIEKELLGLSSFCVESLGSLGAKAFKAVPLLLTKLHQAYNPQLRIACANALSKIASSHAGVLSVIFKAVLMDSDEQVRSNCKSIFLKILDQYPQLSSELVQYLYERGLCFYQEYRLSFAKIGPQNVNLVPTLLNATLQKNSLAWVYIKLLGQIGPSASSAIPFLVNTFENAWRNVNPQVCHASGIALQKIGYVAPTTSLQYRLAFICRDWNTLIQAGADAVNILVAALETQDIKTRCSCAYALGKIGANAQAAVPTLVQFVYNGNHRLQYACVNALGKIKVAAQQAIPILKIRSRSPRRKFAWLCQQAIREIQK